MGKNWQADYEQSMKSKSATYKFFLLALVDKLKADGYNIAHYDMKQCLRPDKFKMVATCFIHSGREKQLMERIRELTGEYPDVKSSGIDYDLLHPEIREELPIVLQDNHMFTGQEEKLDIEMKINDKMRSLHNSSS